MIDFKKFPKTSQQTYIIVNRHYIEEIRTAFELANITDHQLRTCNVKDKSPIYDIKEHLPEWFDARYVAIISHFEESYFLEHLNDIIHDPDVQNEIQKQQKEAEDIHTRYQLWREEPWKD